VARLIKPPKLKTKRDANRTICVLSAWLKSRRSAEALIVATNFALTVFRSGAKLQPSALVAGHPLNQLLK